MVYALFVLLGLVSLSALALRYLGSDVDSSSNFYGSFQNELFARSVYDIAKSCLKSYDFARCESDSIDFGEFSASYTLTERASSYAIAIVVLHRNPRNLHIIRHFVEKEIPK